MMNIDYGLETKFQTFDDETGLKDGAVISGYASVFGIADQTGDVVQPGAYQASLKALKEAGRNVKMLWQHDPSKPIGIWESVHEDQHGLFVKGRILNNIQTGSEALNLLQAGAIDGLSIGYRTQKAEKAPQGGRLLKKLELWEVSLVTFPMLPEARVGSDSDDTLADELVDAIAQARETMLA